MTDLIDVAGVVIAALERLDVRYTVGGSLASSFSGEPRASIDADILVELTVDQVPDFLDLLGDQFYADADALRRAIRTGTSANLIHQLSGIKVDLFVAGSPFDAHQLQRRRRVQVSSTPERHWFIHSPEDILLQKLLWYRRGGEVSDRQWRDVLAIAIVQRDRLDSGYLAETSASIDVADLLGRVMDEARRGRSAE